MNSEFKSVTDIVAIHVLVNLFLHRHAEQNQAFVGEHQSDTFASFEEEIANHHQSGTIVPEEYRKGKVEFEAEDGWELAHWLRTFFNQ